MTKKATLRIALVSLFLLSFLVPKFSFSQGTCASAVNIASLPYTQNGLSNCGRGANVSGGCLNNTYFIGEDYVFRFTPTAATCVNINVTSITGSPWNSGLAITTACPPTAGSCPVAAKTQGNVVGALSLTNVNLNAGTTYYIVVSGGQSLIAGAPNECFGFTFNMAKCVPPPPPLPTDPQGIECGTNLGFEDGNLSNWTGCFHDGSSGDTCTVGGSCSQSGCSGTTTINGVCTCSACGGGGGTPPCCPFQCPKPGLSPGVNSVNAPLGTCGGPPAANVGSHHTVTTGTGRDPNTDNVVPVVAPGGRNYSVRLGNHEPGYQAECMWQSFTVTNQNALFTYLYAVVLQDPSGHPEDAKPRFEITITDQSGNPVGCGGFYKVVSSGAASEGFVKATSPSCGGSDVWYKNWTAVGTDLSAYMGQQITIKFCTADCGQGGHYGYAYVDTYCRPKDVDGKTICTTGQPVTLTAPFGFVNYEWFSGTNTTGTPIGTGQTLVINNPTNGDIYTVVFESLTGSGCKTTVTDTIVVVTATAGTDTTVCNNATGTYQLVASSNDSKATYSWTGGVSNPTSPTPTITLPLANTTTYTVTITSPAGCTLTRSVTVTVQPCQPNVTATGDTICIGETATISASGGGGNPPFNYTWTPNIGTGPGPHSVTPTATTIYTVTLTDANGATATATTRVQVNNQPVLTTNKTDTQCGNCTGSVGVTATGASPFSYVWTPAPGGTTSSLSALCPGTYTVIVTDANGCKDTTTASVNASGSPTVTTSTTNASCPGVCDGTATASPVTGGVTPYTYSWSTTPSQSDSIATGLCANTIYTVTVTDNTGCTATATATLTEPAPIVLTTSTTNASCPGVCDGTATVTVSSGGTSPFTYSWNTTPPQNTYIATGLCAGSYTVTVTDNNGCTKTATVTITEPTPVVLQTTTTNPLCFGECTGTATVTATGGTSPYTYSWATTPVQSTFVATGLCAGTYTVTVTDNKGCTTTASVTITEPPPLVLNITGQSPSCSPDGVANVTVSGGTPSYTMIWNTTPTQQTGPTATGLAPGTYCVTVTDSKGCTKDTCVTLIPPPTFTLATTKVDNPCAGDCKGSIDLTVTGGQAPLTYLWTPGGATTEDVSNLCAGSYVATVRDSNGCIDTAMVTITEPPPIVLTMTKTEPTCVVLGTATVSATGGTPSYTYQWCTGQTTSSASGLQANQVCTVTVTDANGCTITDTVNFVNPALPSADFSWTEGCLGTPSQFTDKSSAGAGDVITSRTWDFGDGNTSSQTNPANTYAAPCKYLAKLTITTQKGCTVSDSDSVNVYPIPVANFGPPKDGCMPVCVDFADSSTVNPCGTITGWSWNFGDPGSGTGNISALQNPQHCYNKDGVYDVSLTVTTDKGCTHTLSRPGIINVYPFPKAAFTADPQVTEILNPQIRFFDLSTGNPVKWYWTFGPGNATDILGDTSNLQNPVVNYKDTGTYKVCLLIENQYTCPHEICGQVIIKPIWTFYIPNAFTPQSDGDNDGFIGKGYNITEHQMWVYDRWGDLVYTTGKTSNPESAMPWNGKVNNGSLEAQQDVYVYVVKIKDIFGKSHRYVGRVTLIR